MSKMNANNLIEDLEIMVKNLEGKTEDDGKIMELIIECDALNESARKLIEEKKKGLISEEDADTRYNALVKKHKEVSKELQKLEDLRNQRLAAIGKAKMTILMLKNSEHLDGEFQIKLWTMLLEKATVYENRKIRFSYYCGYENEVDF